MVSGHTRTSVYLDVCCINRLYDDQSQPRIASEAMAVASILGRLRSREWRWISSEVVNFEVERNPDAVRRARVRLLIAHAELVVVVDQDVRRRAKELEAAGIDAVDALQLASAERGAADVFLTVDDVLLRRAGRVSAMLRTRARNPLEWLRESDGG